MEKRINLSNLVNVGAGQTATLSMPRGNIIYDGVVLDFTGVTKAEMTDFKVKINGNTMQDIASAARIASLNAYYKRAETANEVFIPFRKGEMDIPGDADQYGWGMNDVNTFQTSFKIDPAATNPDITARAIQSAPTKGNPAVLGGITKIREFTPASSAAGTVEIDNIPRVDFIQAIHIDSSLVTAVEVLADNEIIYQGTVAQMEADVERHDRRVRQSGWFHIDWMLKGRSGDQLPVGALNDFRLKLTVSGAGQLPVIVEYLSGFHGA